MQEEQRVIEAKIRMRQQELQDEEERRQTRQAMTSSSRIMPSDGVEYQDISNSSDNAGLMQLLSILFLLLVTIDFISAQVVASFYHLILPQHN